MCTTWALITVYLRPLKHSKQRAVSSLWHRTAVLRMPHYCETLWSHWHIFHIHFPNSKICKEFNIIGDIVLTQRAHCIQYKGSPCIRYLKREWMTELKEVTTCIPVLSWLRLFPVSMEKTQVLQSNQIISLSHKNHMESHEIFLLLLYGSQSHIRRRKQSSKSNSYRWSGKAGKFMVTNVTKWMENYRRQQKEPRQK